jgi:flagellum-specific ATP synthase
MVDSVTRLAMAQREVGLAAGEPPATRGYTPSVFAMLPRLLERAGTSDGAGSITGLYTVLVEGDDMNEPVADTVRGILDGHIVLSRRLASRGHYPAIDVLQSISRSMNDIVSRDVLQASSDFREIMASYQETEDLLTIGAYKPGQNARVDRAVKKIEAVNTFLKQEIDDPTALEDCWAQIRQILGE